MAGRRSRLPVVEHDPSAQLELERRLRLAQAELGVARAELDRQLRELHARDRLVQAQMRGLGWAQARRLILEVVAAVVDVEELVFYDVDEVDSRLRPTAAFGGAYPKGHAPQEHLDALPPPRREDSDHLASIACAEGQPRSGASGDACAVPLVHGDAVLGVVWLRTCGETHLRAEDPFTLWRLCQQAAVLLHSARVAEGPRHDGLVATPLLELEVSGKAR